MTDTFLIFGSLFVLGIAISVLFVFTDLFWDCWDDVSKDELIELDKYRKNDESN
tara:strand:+ start:615 stop:776 length:162 start_codon:yes stop_codon:yes gene_type:complete